MAFSEELFSFSLVSIAIKHLLVIAVSVDCHLPSGRIPNLTFHLSFHHSKAFFSANVRGRLKKSIFWYKIHECWDNAPLCCREVKLVSIRRPSIIFTTTGSPDTWGVSLFEQSNTEQTQTVPTVFASTSAPQSEHLPSKVNTLSEKHDWTLQFLLTYFPVEYVCNRNHTENKQKCKLQDVRRHIWSRVYRQSVYLMLAGWMEAFIVRVYMYTNVMQEELCL